MSQKPLLQAVEQPSKEAFVSWKKNKITQRFFAIMKDERERMTEGLVYNLFEDEANVKGRIQTIDAFLSIDWEKLYGE